MNEKANADAPQPANQEAPELKDATAPGSEEKKAGSGAARPRKWDYGIKPEASVVRTAPTKDAEGKDVVIVVKADMAKEYEFTAEKCTVEQFFAKGGTRHGLRVMSRRKLVTIVAVDGTVYPIKYTAPEKPTPKPKAEKKVAKKKVVKKAAPAAPAPAAG